MFNFFKKKSKEKIGEISSDSLNDISLLAKQEFKLCKVFWIPRVWTDSKEQFLIYFYCYLNDKNERKVVYCSTNKRLEHEERSKFVAINSIFVNNILIPWLSGYNFDNIPKYNEIGSEEIKFFKKLEDIDYSLYQKAEY